MTLCRTLSAHVAWAFLVCLLALVTSAAAENEVEWTVAIDDPTSGKLKVMLRIPLASIGNRSPLGFTFPDAHDFSGRVSGFRVSIASKSVETEEHTTQRGVSYRAPIADESGESIVVAYTVDARFYPPGSEGGARRDARAILEPELGVLRTRTVFVAGQHTALAARLTFDLPEGWGAITPWDQESNTFLLPPNALRGKTEYLGIGPFEVTETEIGATPYRIGAMGAGNELIEKLPALIEFEQRIAGTSPRDANARHSIVLAPRGFIQGGSAGRLSVVQSPNAVTLAHEIFHWWNHSGIATPEARWFGEGFTEYFAIQAAVASGLISGAYAKLCFADLNGEMRFLERDGPVSLADASQRYSEREAQRLVYGKGALFAYWLDSELRKVDRELHEVLPVVFANPNRRHDNGALAEAFDLAFEGAMNDAFNMYVENANPLPDLGLPEATGKSGRTRFLPNR